LLAAGLLLAIYAGIIVFGSLLVNDEIECGSPVRPASTAAMPEHDAARCRTGLAELRVQAVTSATLAGLSLLGFFLVPRRS
jgi:hypothetical protein